MEATNLLTLPVHKPSRRDFCRIAGASAAVASVPMLAPTPADAFWQAFLGVILRGFVKVGASTVARSLATSPSSTTAVVLAGAFLAASSKKTGGLIESALSAGGDAAVQEALKTHAAVWFQQDETLRRNGVSVPVQTRAEPLRGKLIILVKDAHSGLIDINYDSEYITMDSHREGYIHFSAPLIPTAGSKIVETYFENTPVAPPSKIFVLEGTYAI